MGDEDTDNDAIWTPADAAPDDPPPAPGHDDDIDDLDDLWLPTAGDDGDGPHRSHRVRIALGVVCLSVAALAAFLVLTGDDEPDQRAVGKAVSAEPKVDASVLSSAEDAPAPAAGAIGLVPSTVPEGAVVKCGNWDEAVNFEPQEMTDGVYIWSDFQGWHVRSVGPSVGTVTGKISGSVRPNLFDQPEPERVDASGPEDGTEIYFTIRPGDTPEGFDFSAGCTQQALGFDLKSDAEPIDPALVHLGTKGGVTAVPFIVSRVPEPG